MNYNELYEEWLSNPYFDGETKKELESIRDDEDEIKENVCPVCGKNFVVPPLNVYKHRKFSCFRRFLRRTFHGVNKTKHHI